MTTRIAWAYESASWQNGDGEYAGWVEHISFVKPDGAAQGAVRNLREVAVPPPVRMTADEKALDTALRISYLRCHDRSQFISLIQVAVREAMDWACEGTTKITD